MADVAAAETMAVEVLDAAELAQRDTDTIAGGVPSRALMQRAAAAAAAEITRRYPALLRERGAAVYTGTGNNGGDAWAVAGMLARVGVRTRVASTGEPRSADARAERDAARPLVEPDPPGGWEGLVVDGVLGIGSQGAPTGAAAEAIATINRFTGRGARVVSLDVPSGLDASTGAADGAVVADLTVTFGAIKRGLLVARGHSGAIVVVDVGFAPPREARGPGLVTADWIARRLPLIAPDAHKGKRGYVAIVGGGAGMAGAAALAATASLASGVGIAKAVVAPQSVAAVQALVPEALSAAWPDDRDVADVMIARWAHAVLIGPGLGTSPRTRQLIDDLLAVWRGPVVLDADALNLFAGDVAALAALLGGRPALITPHVAEFARLSGSAVDAVLDHRFDVGLDLARELGATVLLKGVPTVITAPDGRRMVSATGTPALATGGSGDVLGGISATLLAQTGDAFVAGACAAWVHGRAAEIASRGRPLRGVGLARVIRALPGAWNVRVAPPRYPVLASVPGVARPR